jgi:spermidine synthase
VTGDPGRIRLHLAAFLSGAGLLASEVVWNRSLLVVTGGSTDATATVLSTIMAGLGAGGLVFGRIGAASASPSRLLAILAALCAAAFPLPVLLGGAIGDLMRSLASSGIPAVPARIAVSAVALLPPCILAGGLLPLLARLSEGGDGRRTVAALYASNTLGAATGGLAAGFVALELAGARATALLASLLMLAAAVSVPRVRGAAAAREARGGPAPSRMLLYAASGLVALAWEAVWSRQLTFVLGNSSYAFTTMGAAALAGMAAGSWAGRLPRGEPLVLFGLAVALEGLFGALPLLVTRMLPGAAAGFASILPASICMGATFPLIVRASGRPGSLCPDVGLLSMANSLGAAAGPFVATWALMETAGPTHGTAILAVASACVAAAAIVQTGRVAARAAIPAAALPAAVLALVVAAPGSIAPRGLVTLFFDEDRVATVAVFGRADGYRSLRINGVEEVPVDQASLEAFHLLGHLPWGYRPGASSAAVVAFGGGITLGGVLSHGVEEVVCIELCPSVTEASPIFAAENGSPELDPRLELVGDDGRNYLASCARSFDLIICDATHPGSADSWVLYTREFYSQVLARLSSGGIAAQWVPLHQLPVDDLRRILATWSSVFPECAVHLAGGRHAILIGSGEPLDLEVEAMFDTPRARASLESAGLRAGEPWYLEAVAGTEGLAALSGGSGLNTDDRAPCQFIRRRAPRDPQATIRPCAVLLLSAPGGSDPLREAQALYWDGRLPEAVEALRPCIGSAIGRRWLSTALTTAAELSHGAGRAADAAALLDEAGEADPTDPRVDGMRSLLYGGV